MEVPAILEQRDIALRTGCITLDEYNTYSPFKSKAIVWYLKRNLEICTKYESAASLVKFKEMLHQVVADIEKMQAVYFRQVPLGWIEEFNVPSRDIEYYIDTHKWEGINPKWFEGGFYGNSKI